MNCGLSIGVQVMGDRRIREVLSPSENAGDVVDWAAAADAWGHGFPDDYREFVRCYGEGDIEQFMAVLVPGVRLPLDGNGMYEESANARLTWEEDAQQDPSALIRGVEGGNLVAWGVDTGADILCWDTSAEDPNAWPVVIYCRQNYPSWSRFEMGMTRFLLAIFSGELEEMPLSGSDLWEMQSLRFMHKRDMKILRSRGINPWAGGSNSSSSTSG
ncbi:SMI1/KNR4 family protein [Streptomyces avicenniae]|uniref:SMI1/KNR4 family protein n=1 Tax=Streptomyces avicenniae TaxID=500153 RepID=UPI000DA62156|nr:SMI1/KNR4 family protein [Streptomyces avicenniae]